MAGPQLRAALAVLALATGGCDGRRAEPAQVSITVKLPPAKPRVHAPGFEFGEAREPRVGSSSRT
jgi:hypothetical protein